MVQANDTYQDWIGPIEVNLSAYETQTIDLTFGDVSVGEATGNLRFDYIELLPGPTAIRVPSWGVIKILYR